MKRWGLKTKDFRSGGFTVLEALIIIAIIFLLLGVWYVVANRNSTSNSEGLDDDTTTQEVDDSIAGSVKSVALSYLVLPTGWARTTSIDNDDEGCSRVTLSTDNDETVSILRSPAIDKCGLSKDLSGDLTLEYTAKGDTLTTIGPIPEDRELCEKVVSGFCTRGDNTLDVNIIPSQSSQDNFGFDELPWISISTANIEDDLEGQIDRLVAESQSLSFGYELSPRTVSKSEFISRDVVGSDFYDYSSDRNSIVYCQPEEDVNSCPDVSILETERGNFYEFTIGDAGEAVTSYILTGQPEEDLRIWSFTSNTPGHNEAKFEASLEDLRL